VIEGDDVISPAEWLDLMFELLGALRPAVNENDRTPASLSYVAELDAIGRNKDSSGEIAHDSR